MIRIAIAVLGLWLIAGCAPLSAKLDGSDESQKVVYLIGYAQAVAAMRPEGQRRELKDANQTYAKDRHTYASLRLALLLSLPGTPFFDDARAAGLLDPFSGTTESRPAAGSLRQFAAWLHAQIGERMREQHKSAQLKEQLNALRATQIDELTREQHKSAQLKEHLESLRAIERTLNNLGQGRPK